MKVLIAINYQREIPPFMITELKYAERFFDKIKYVTPELYEDNSDKVTNDKVKVIQVEKKYRRKAVIKSVGSLFRREVRSDIKGAIQEKKFGKGFLIHLAKEIYPSEVIFGKVKKILDKEYQGNDICLLASWFNCNAYVAAKLKKNFPNIMAVSFAHAFEVNPERSPYIDLSLNAFKHKYLDKVSFISSKVMKSYLNTIRELPPKDIDKIDVYYLGSPNNIDKINIHKSEKFCLCSCSGMSEVKRIDLILDSLEGWNKGKILWTHIGSGALWEKIKRRAEYIINNNPLVEIQLVGKYDNESVHEFYKNNLIDLFINVSTSEGLPVSIMEAISYGIPVIATNVGGTSEIVNEQDGFLLPADVNGEDIRKTIQKYMDLTEEEKIQLRRSSRRLWCDRFDSEKNASKYFENIVKSMIKYKNIS